MCLQGELLGVDYLLSPTGQPLKVDPRLRGDRTCWRMWKRARKKETRESRKTKPLILLCQVSSMTQTSLSPPGLVPTLNLSPPIKSLYLHFVPLHCPKIVLFVSVFFFFFQTVGDSGVPGIKRVDSLAECLVELRKPALSDPQQPAGQEQLLSCYFPSVSCHTCSHLHVFVFSCAVVLSLCLGDQHCCSLAEPAALRQGEAGVF